MTTRKSAAPLAVEAIAGRIITLRGERVLLDAALAALYGVTTKALNQAVKRNSGRFPDDFAFQLTASEAVSLKSQFAASSRKSADPKKDISNRSQIVTGSQKHRDPRFSPWVFTEHGALMAANLLRSERAVQVSVYVVRAFVQLRSVLATHRELASRLAELETRIEKKLHAHDRIIADILDAIRQLMAPPDPPKKRRIGFISGD